jgi:translation initiation factor IF-2
MSKIRIYELAKELGVDNKVVISKAAELGFVGKLSHSNTLDDDEVSQIRRAIIRQAIGARPDSEVRTQRVDKVTGETEAIVEKRKGNVIRRRRAATDDAPGGAGEESLPLAASSTSAHGGTQEVVMSERGISVEPPEAEEVIEPPSPVITRAEVLEPEVIEEEPEEVLVTEAVAPAVEETIVTPEVVPAPPVTPKPLPPGVISTRPAAAAAPAVEVKKGPGPRVLGRIELPIRRPAKAEPKRQETGFGQAAPVAAPVDDEETRNSKARKSRSKKREISRGDLVDYEGREGRVRPRAGGKGRAMRSDSRQAEQPKQQRTVTIGDSILVAELAKQMSVKAGEVIAKLLELGMMATINQAIDKDTATLIAEEFGCEIVSSSFDEAKILEQPQLDIDGDAVARPPVVTIMGHVDHGKTTLLDTIRNADVAAGEAGGITQHIGAYQVTTKSGQKIAFIDTPGHAAFTSMRARGASVTDIVIVVVAADDGVMPQTVEAINHARAAKVPIIVAINKIDKPGVGPDRIKQALVEHGLQPEDWGGDTMYYPVSALKKQGIEQLLEGILLQAEVKELKANPSRRARGTIIESRKDIGRGTVATVLVQNGTLRIGDTFVCGSEFGRVRSMTDYLGARLDEAPPSTPVEITGFSGVPQAGDDFFVVEDEAAARDVSTNRSQKRADRDRANAAGPISLEEFAKRANNVAAQDLNVIIKGDVHGSVEAVRMAVEKLSGEKVKVRVLHSAVGGINESDVELAKASRALIIGFNVRGEVRALAVAEQAEIEVRFYRIIYELIDDVKKSMAGLLAPIRQESKLGRVEVRETFVIPKAGTIAGCFVVDGLVRRGAHVRLLRDSKVVFEGKMSSLRRFKDDAREVQSGYECGIGLENFNDVKTGDVMEVFEYKEIAATLD